MIEQPELPYALDALEPWLSADTLDAHYNGHLRRYVHQVNELVSRTPLLRDADLAGIVRLADRAKWVKLWEAAAQVANHTFYFRCMSPDGGGEPTDERLAYELRESFGSYAAFTKRWTDAATSVFGSGWVWLVRSPRRGLEIVTTKDAAFPVRGKLLLVMDVWEHAYYLDYTYRRARYADVFLEHLVDWSLASS